MNHPKQFQGSLHSLTLYVKPPSSSIFSTTRDGSEMWWLDASQHLQIFGQRFWAQLSAKICRDWKKNFFPSFRLHCASKLWLRNVLPNQNRKYLNCENNKGDKGFSLVIGLLLFSKMLYHDWRKHMKSRVKKLLAVHCYSYFIIKLYNSYS